MPPTPSCGGMHITRARLHIRLVASQHAHMTLVSAPAGYGKTTLVRSWVRSRVESNGAAAALDTGQGAGHSVIAAAHPAPADATAWLSLEESHDHFPTFLVSLVSALRASLPDAFPRTREAIRNGGAALQTEAVSSLFVEECQSLPCKVLLVLDDLHLLQNQETHRLLVRLVRSAHETLHLVVVTRCDPPWGIARLRAEGRLMEVRAADLHFTREEAARLILLHANLEDPAVVDVLHRRTEGWAAGLILALVGLKSHASPSAFLRGFERSGSRYLIDYLADEVLEPQPQEIQSFLLRTAVLDRFSAPLCAALAGDGNEAAAHQAIRYLLEHNLFLVALEGDGEDEGEWYRFHQEFRSLLLLRGFHSPASIRLLHRRAGSWYASHGQVDDALTHYRAAQDHDAAAALIEDALPKVFAAARWHDLERWIEQAPSTIVMQRPLLLLARCARKLVNYRRAAIPPLLTQAARLLEEGIGVDTPQARATAQGLLAAIRCSFASASPQHSDLPAYAEEALRLLPPEHEWAIGLVHKCLADYAIRNGQAERALVTIRGQLDSMPRQWVTLRCRLEFVQTYVLFMVGTNDQLYRGGRRLLHAALAAGIEVEAAKGRFAIAAALCEQGDFDGALALLETIVQPSDPIPHTLVYLLSARLLLALCARTGRPERGLEMVAELRRREAKDELVGMGSQIDALEALAAHQAGDADALRAWTARASLGPYDGFADHESLILARGLLLERSDASLARAADVAQTYLQRRAAEHFVRGEIEGGLLLAAILWAQGKSVRALATFERALVLAWPRGYRMCFDRDDADLVEMLHALVLRRHDAGIAAGVLAAGVLAADVLAADVLAADVLAYLGDPRCKEHAHTKGHAPSKSGRHEPAREEPGRSVRAEAPLIEPLTDREVLVLRALARGLSNKEIARELSVSAFTVRFHASNVYAKLHVGTRAQAVERAQELGLLALSLHEASESGRRPRGVLVRRAASPPN